MKIDELKNRIASFDTAIQSLRVTRDIIAESGICVTDIETMIDSKMRDRRDTQELYLAMQRDNISCTVEYRKILHSRHNRLNEELRDNTRTTGRIDRLC